MPSLLLVRRLAASKRLVTVPLLAVAVAGQRVAGLLRAGFADLPDRCGLGHACCDRFEDTITLRTDGVTKTVIVVDGADAPDALWQQVRELRGLLPLVQA